MALLAVKFIPILEIIFVHYFILPPGALFWFGSKGLDAMFEATRSTWNVSPRNLLPSCSFPCKYVFQSVLYLLEIDLWLSWWVLFVCWENCVTITALFDLLPGWCNDTMIFRTCYINVLNPVFFPEFIRQYFFRYGNISVLMGMLLERFFALPIGLVAWLVTFWCSYGVIIGSLYLCIDIG